jgi:hypothetical protein
VAEANNICASLDKTDTADPAPELVRTQLYNLEIAAGLQFSHDILAAVRSNARMHAFAARTSRIPVLRLIGSPARVWLSIEQRRSEGLS